ncbi:hypothetical protein EPUS_06016 [Endocarpon pusillum Z07020]|uniref:Phytocyanin domain-containing protein n=1 Tax=Endocarpon pusillum (strain Z07020 / HMAS-L-300199) TaxID=1263415 RepID=U1G1R8_ENDPU|nr:uncharacterized protein EPUS_06016 [Endocarpon pusillum Z07020]ERF71187.1 hypothetical protein EPUS_06016 [Endocarpon pusillum Z07020]
MGALANTGSEPKDMGASGGGIDSSSSINSDGKEEIQLNIGPVQIKIVGSFSGLGKWQWEGAKPGENSTVHQVTVGDLKDGQPVLAYDPPSIDAQPGDYVQFNFKANNHTVTQSTFEKPCVKMPGGMDSGFMPNIQNNMPVPPSMMVAINDTQPLWFYCRQGTHCGEGMAFGINPGGAAKMDEFLNLARSQNGTNVLASNSTSSGNGTAGGQNGLPASSAVANPTASPLSNLVPGSGSESAGGPGSGGDACNCNCLCDLGSPSNGGLVGSIPLPSAGALGRRSVKY